MLCSDAVHLTTLLRSCPGQTQRQEQRDVHVETLLFVEGKQVISNTM